MSFTLRIFIMGFVALVPGQGSKSLVAVLPVAPSAHKHVPVLVYPCGKLGSSCNSYDARDVHDELKLDADVRKQRLFVDDDHTYGALLLKGEYIDISNLPGGTLSFLTGQRRTGWLNNLDKLPEAMREVSDFSWVPPMSDISSKAAMIKNSFVIDPNARDVSALFRLDDVSGVVRSFTLAQDGDVIPSLKFKTSDSVLERGVVKQAVADSVVIEVQVQQPYVDLSTLSFDGAAGRSIRLAPEVGSRVVDILIANLTPLPPRLNAKDIVNGVRATDIPVDIGSHFFLYYGLAAEFDPKSDPMRLPQRGWYSVKATGLKPESPNVIKVVGRDDGISGNSRPICTIVTFSGAE